jgi:hypothetical protein
MNIDEYIRQNNQMIINATGKTDTVDPITKLTDDLYIGQGRATAYGDVLTTLGITHVVSIGRTPHDAVKNGPFYKFELQGALDVGHEHLSVHFPVVFNFMRDAIKNGGKVFVHCEMAVSRAPTIVIAFLRAEGYFNSLQETYNFVKRKRPWISPNGGFIRQLRKFFSEKLVCH